MNPQRGVEPTKENEQEDGDTTATKNDDVCKDIIHSFRCPNNNTKIYSTKNGSSFQPAACR